MLEETGGGGMRGCKTGWKGKDTRREVTRRRSDKGEGGG